MNGLRLGGGALIVVACAAALWAAADPERPAPANEKAPIMTNEQKQEATESAKPDEKNAKKVVKTEAEWREMLTPEQYHVTREKGTERAYTGKYWDHKEDGVYKCIGCGTPLFDSATKFEAECGWPSFFKPIADGDIEEEADYSFNMTRTEVVCRKCDAHLGHVFPDGPKPTGLRYCINSASLNFEKRPTASTSDKKPEAAK